MWDNPYRSPSEPASVAFGGRWLDRRWVIVAALVLLPVGYVASYYALVQTSPGPPLDFYGIHHPHRATYRIGGVAAEYFFAPMHDFDRIVRRSYWRDP